MTWPSREHSGPGGLGFEGYCRKGELSCLFVPRGRKGKSPLAESSLKAPCRQWPDLLSNGTFPEGCGFVFESLLQSLSLDAGVGRREEP